MRCGLVQCLRVASVGKCGEFDEHPTGEGFSNSNKVFSGRAELGS